jgi:hypothetical protein
VLHMPPACSANVGRHCAVVSGGQATRQGLRVVDPRAPVATRTRVRPSQRWTEVDRLGHTRTHQTPPPSPALAEQWIGWRRPRRATSHEKKKEKKKSMHTGACCSCCRHLDTPPRSCSWCRCPPLLARAVAKGRARGRRGPSRAPRFAAAFAAAGMKELEVRAVVAAGGGRAAAPLQTAFALRPRTNACERGPSKNASVKVDNTWYIYLTPRKPIHGTNI